MASTPGERFRTAMAEEKPLQIPGTINAYTALLAQREGYRAIYLSGAGVANASYGMPDLGMTSMSDVLVDIERITAACSVPLLVDADTGWGHSLCIARTIQAFIKAGAAAVHIEDQMAAKRCGHRPNKSMVSTEEMVDRLHAAVDSRTDESFVIMARTDALAEEGVERSIERCQKYIEAGADVIFAEAITDAEQYRLFTQSLSVPVLANMTEFGMSPLMTVEHLSEVGVELVLYPLSVFRVTSQAAVMAYETIRKSGTQSSIVERMQTREELYEVLDYHAYEQKIDDLLKEADAE